MEAIRDKACVEGKYEAADTISKEVVMVEVEISRRGATRGKAIKAGVETCMSKLHLHLTDLIRRKSLLLTHTPVQYHGVALLSDEIEDLKQEIDARMYCLIDPDHDGTGAGASTHHTM